MIFGWWENDNAFPCGGDPFKWRNLLIQFRELFNAESPASTPSTNILGTLILIENTQGLYLNFPCYITFHHLEGFWQQCPKRSELSLILKRREADGHWNGNFIAMNSIYFSFASNAPNRTFSGENRNSRCWFCCPISFFLLRATTCPCSVLCALIELWIIELLDAKNFSLWNKIFDIDLGKGSTRAFHMITSWLVLVRSIIPALANYLFSVSFSMSRWASCNFLAQIKTIDLIAACKNY